ncbi:type IV secretory system conjugative DNA transfer family protein [Mycobacterium sp. NPDC051198]
MLRTIERGGLEPVPERCVVDVIGLRAQSASMAAELRASLPVRLAGIVGEVVGAELELGMFTDPDGMVGIGLAVSAGGHTEATAAEIAQLLAPVAELSMRDGGPEADSEWPLVADTRRGRLGFVAADASAQPTLSWRPGADPAQQLVEELAAVPGHGIRIRVRPTHTVPARWGVELCVVTAAGKAPVLRMRSAIRRRFPGLQIAAEQEDSAVRLLLDDDGLAAVFTVPVAGAEPLAGTYPAPPAPIPTTPGRDAEIGGLRIGHALTGGGRPIPVELSEEERLRHVHVLGRTGTGKSSALAGLAYGLSQRDEGAIIVDPHGQLCDRILAELPDSEVDRVWLIRCADVDNPVPVNALAESDPVRRDIAIAELCATFQYLFDPNQTGIVGPRFHERVGMTLRALTVMHGTRASLLDVPIATENETFLAAAVRRSGDERLKSWWKVSELAKRSNEHGEVLAWVNSKFERLSNTAAMRAILGSGCNAVDFAQAMDDGRIILLDLSKADLGEQASRMLGFMYLGRVWDGALRRELRSRPFTVIVDEAHTLISGALTNMLSEGRKFGLSVVLAHQYLDQLDKDLRPAVDGNVATTIAFRSAVSDAAELHKRFGGLVATATLVSQPDLSAVSLRTAASGLSRPHTLVVDHNELVPARAGAELAQRLELIRINTETALIDPHREFTAAAAAGRSNVATFTDSAGDRARPRPARRGDPTAPAKSASFLDEWLAKRAAQSVGPAEDVGLATGSSAGR